MQNNHINWWLSFYYGAEQTNGQNVAISWAKDIESWLTK